MPNNKVVLEALTVLPDRIEAIVCITDETCYFTTPQLISEITKTYPTLAYHTCRNKVGPTFGAVMQNTSTAHLLEHLVIDIQMRMHEEKVANLRAEKTSNQKTLNQSSASQVVFTGTTQQSKDYSNKAIVQVSFLDDLIALAAFKEALNYLNKMLNMCLHAS